MSRSSKMDGYQYIKGVLLMVDRGQTKVCVLCQKQFSIGKKEHQCKRCKRPVCERCSPNKQLMPDDQKLHRICNFCKDESDRLQSFIDDHHICFTVDTLSIEWLKCFGSSLQNAKSEYYEDASKDVRDLTEYNIFKGQLGNVFKEIQVGQTYSLRDFYIKSLKSNSKDRVFQSVEQVLEVFLKQHPQVGYSPDLVMVTLFLLYFASIPTTYCLLKIIYLKIIPSYLLNRSLRLKPYDYKEEISNILNLNAKINKSVSQEFLENRIYRYISTFTINLLMFETTFHVINEMFTSKDPYQAFLKQLSLCVNMTNTEILQIGNNYGLGEVFILRQVTANKISNLELKTRSMSITLIDYQNQGQQGGEDLKGSQIISLKSELTSQKLTTDVLMSKIEKLQLKIAEQEEIINNHQIQQFELEKSILNLKSQVSTLQSDDKMDILEVRSSYESAQTENQQLKAQLDGYKVKVQEQSQLIKQQNAEIYELRHQIQDLKKIEKNYGATIVEEDAILLQDIRDMEKDLDPTKKKLFNSFVQQLKQLQIELKYKEQELKLKKEEVIQNPVIERLRQELMQMEQELSDANIQLIEYRRQDKRLSIQSQMKPRQNYTDLDQQIGCSNNKDCIIF